jgi:hypothetical protein
MTDHAELILIGIALTVVVAMFVMLALAQGERR